MRYFSIPVEKQNKIIEIGKHFLKVFLTVSEDSVSSHLASSVFEAECHGGQQVSEPRGAPRGARK